MAVFARTYPVRFGDIDHAGVMYYPRFFDRMHQAFEDFWPECAGAEYAELLDGQNIGFPTVDVHCAFRRPFRFGERMRVEIDVLRIGTRSVTFRFRLFGEGEEDWRAQAELVTGVIDLEKFVGKALPQGLRTALEPYLVADGAG